MKKNAFTLIELLVVIAIIAILAAILFPVFSRAKESAKKTQSVAQMRQLAAAVMMYAGDYDDFFVPASMRSGIPGETPVIWTEGIAVYVKNQDIMVAPGSDGGYATNWASRHHQSVGYSDATGVEIGSTVQPGNAPPGTEGFPSAVSFSSADETTMVGLFAVTANAPKGTFNTKHRGYVFNPYNGLNSPDNDYRKGLPKISDLDLVTNPNDPRYPNSPALSPGQLKPIYCRYQSDGKGAGTSPVVFADGHTKSYSSNALNSFGTVIWRFR